MLGDTLVKEGQGGRKRPGLPFVSFTFRKGMKS